MTIPHPEAIQRLDKRVVTSLSDQEKEVFDFYRKEGQRFDVAVLVSNEIELEKLGAENFQADEHKTRKPTTGRISVTVGPQAANLWSSTTRRSEKQSTRLDIALGWFSFIPAGWLLFYPRPYFLCVIVCMLFPVVLLLASRVNQDRWSLVDDGRNQLSNKIGLAGPLGVICSALSLRAFIDFNFADARGLMLFVGIVALAISLALWKVIPRASLSMAILIGLAYSFPAVVYINASGQDSQHKPTVGTVVKKHVYTKPFIRTVVVSADGKDHEFVINKESFSNVELGSQLCVTERYGLLRMSTLRLEQCPP